MTLKSIMLTLAALLFFVAAIQFLLSWNKYRRYSKSQGEIVDSHAEVSFDREEKEYSHYAFFRFTDQAGREHLIQSNVGNRTQQYRPGEAVRVLYDPDDPSKATLDKFSQKYAWATFIFWTAVFAAIVGLFAR